MAKIITFSRKYQKKHPKSGQATFFVEKILNALGEMYYMSEYLEKLIDLNKESLDNGKLTHKNIVDFYLSLDIPTHEIKIHTIRGNTRFKVNEEFQPAVWSGKPYCSPIIRFWDIVPIKHITEIEYYDCNLWFGNQVLDDDTIKLLAANDGLTRDDFIDWICEKEFHGQVLHFTDFKY